MLFFLHKISDGCPYGREIMHMVGVYTTVCLALGIIVVGLQPSAKLCMFHTN